MSFEQGSVCIAAGRGVTCIPWSGFAAYLASAVVVLLLVLGVLVWDARRTTTPSQAARRANRHATMASSVGVVMLAVVLMWLALAAVLGVTPSDGRLLALLPVLAGACLLVAQAVGQLTWPRPSGSHREAELIRRDVADVTPTWLRRLGHVWAVAALLLLGVFALVADGPRSMTRVAGAYTEAIGPYPGGYYGVPMALAVVMTVVASELVLRMTAVRPAVAGVSVEWDLHLRRRSATHVTRGIQLILGLTVAGLLVAAGRVHLSLGQAAVPLSGGGFAYEGSSGDQGLGVVLLGAAAGVLLVALGGLVLPLRRARPAASTAVRATVTA